MASSNYTTNLGLCDWAATDRPKRADFVSDNGIIDSVLGGHVNNAAIHMSAAEKTKALEPFDIRVYSGDGTSTRTITAGFRPSFAVVFKRDNPPVVYDSGVNVVNSAYSIYGSGSSSGLSIVSNGISVRQQATASDGMRISLNETDCQYIAVLFK
jgi:hypothetical protein